MGKKWRTFWKIEETNPKLARTEEQANKMKNQDLMAYLRQAWFGGIFLIPTAMRRTQKIKDIIKRISPLWYTISGFLQNNPYIHFKSRRDGEW